MKSSYGAVPTTINEALTSSTNDSDEMMLGQENSSVPFNSRRTPRFIITLLFVVAALFAVTSLLDQKMQIQLETLDKLEIMDDLDLSFAVTYDYVEIFGPPGADYPWYYKYIAIVEPYREAKLYVSEVGLSAIRVQDTASYSYEWKIDDVETFTGSSIAYTFTDLGVHHIVLTELDSTGAITRESSGLLMCKYVRREIRNLFESDRIAFLNAAEAVFKTSEDLGQQLYGDRFHSIDYFTRIHNNMGGALECDHFHNGLGFCNHHQMFTSVFEQALQAVDPSVTVPYWDYTIEAYYVYTEGTSDAWWSSIVFGDDWLGTASPSNYVVDSGRWAYIPVRTNASSFQTVTNAYGLMRSPWNQNKIPYVTRYNKTFGFEISTFPDCGSHYEQLLIDYYYEFGMDIQNEPHGVVHTAIGGVWNSNFRELFVEENNFNYSVYSALALEAFGWQKNMWRAGLMRCPTLCSMDTPESECKCFCPQLSQWIENKQARSILYIIGGLFKQSNAYIYYVNNDGEEKSDILLRAICNDFDNLFPSIGDNVESAAPNDIIFWPTHPTVERLLVWKRLHGFLDTTWVDNSSTTVTGLTIGYCYGHNYMDVTIWKNIFDNDDVYYTNAEIFNLSNPDNENLEYVFDNFLWPHCEALGFPLDLIVGDSDDDTE